MPLRREAGLALAAVAAAAFPAHGAAAGEGGESQPAQARQHWLVEFKRQATSRGTPEETTKTNLKFDYSPDGPVSLLRLELPFPDEKSDFTGSPFDPDYGDAKVRAGFRAVEIAGRPVTPFLELTFPTADPESQGTGKYQLSAGVKTALALGPGAFLPGAQRRSFSVQVQQVVSFAGDAARKDINQTKFELEWRDTWAGGHWAKATAKPVVDWVGDGRTGAVLELEGGWIVNREWSLALMIGGILWGEGVPGTYGTRSELKVIRRF